MTRPRRVPERGSITPLVIYGTLIVCVMGIGGATIGRIVHGKRETQNAADSAALAAADMTREEGLRANRTAALTLAQHNSRMPTPSTITAIDDRMDWLTVATRATQSIDTPRFIFDGNTRVQARAKARIDQERRSLADAPTPDVVLVLDYSGSMTGTPIATLEDAIKGHLNDQRIVLSYAAALFSDTLVGSVPFAPDSISQIIDLFLHSDAGGGTSPEFGFDKATEFLGTRSEGVPRFVVFVSDGEPNDVGAATAGSTRMWDEAKPTVMTIHIGAPGASPFMVSVSGKPDNRGDKDYYFPVNDMDSFRRALAQILSKIACPLEKLKRERIKDVSTVRAFLQDRNGNEVKLKSIEDLDNNADALGFFFNPQTYDIAVTIEACVLMRNEKQSLVVRYNRAVLVE